MELTREITLTDKLNFILFSRGIVWTYKKFQTTWASLRKNITANNFDEGDVLMIERTFKELYPDGVYNLPFYIKLVALIALYDKTAVAPMIGITMYKMKVKLETMNWKEKEILMIEKVYNEEIEDIILV